LPIYGDGKNIREWIHVSDHVHAIQVVLQKGKPGEIYNIGTGVLMSNNDLADELIKLMNLNESMKAYVADRKGHDFRYSIDSTKIENLGYERYVEFNDGLKQTVDWFKSNPGWWNMQRDLIL
jgi:dTDP-glucose 4,6-dehydratase